MECEQSDLLHGAFTCLTMAARFPAALVGTIRHCTELRVVSQHVLLALQVVFEQQACNLCPNLFLCVIALLPSTNPHA